MVGKVRRVIDLVWRSACDLWRINEVTLLTAMLVLDG